MKKSLLTSKMLEEKFATYNAAHAAAVAAKEDLLRDVQKLTSGKANITFASLDDCEQWYFFSKDNADWVTKRFNLSDFEQKLILATMLNTIEKDEEKDRGFSTAIHKILMSDLREYWSDSEKFYAEAAKDDSTVKEKYKSLKSLSPERQTPEQKEKVFLKLEEERNQKLAKKAK